MTQPTEVDWDVYRGDWQEKYWPVLGPGSVPIGDATGWTARVQVRRSADSPVLLEWDPAEVDVGADPDDDEAPTTLRVKTLIEPDTPIPFNDARYDIEVTPPSGETTTVYAGRFRVTRDVSHD